MYTLIVTAKLNDVDPQAWLADVFARIADLPHTASAVPKVRVNGRSEDVIFFDGVFFESSLKSIFFAS